MIVRFKDCTIGCVGFQWSWLDIRLYRSVYWCESINVKHSESVSFMARTWIVSHNLRHIVKPKEKNTKTMRRSDWIDISVTPFDVLRHITNQWVSPFWCVCECIESSLSMHIMSFMKSINIHQNPSHRTIHIFESLLTPTAPYFIPSKLVCIHYPSA